MVRLRPSLRSGVTNQVADNPLLAPPTKEEMLRLSAPPTKEELLMAPPSEEELKTVTRPKVGAAEAAMHGAAQGATFGFADEATAALGAAKDWTAGKLGMRGDISLSDAYNSYLPGLRSKMVDAPLADQKAAFIGGNVVGGLATLAVPGVAIAKGAKLGASVGKAAGLGALAGAGTSEAEVLSTDFAKDVAVGGIVGGVLQAGGYALSKSMQKATPSALREYSNVQAAKAAGAIGSDLKRIGPQKVQRMGEELHRAGLKAFDSLDDVADKVATGKQAAGEAIGSALDQVDDLVAKAKGFVDGMDMPDAAKANLKASIDKKFQFNMGRIAERLESELIAPNADNPMLAGEMNKLAVLAERFKPLGTKDMRTANMIKGSQARLTKFNSETVPETFKKEVYSIIRSEIDDVIGRTGTLEEGVAKMSGNTLGQGGQAAAKNQSALAGYLSAKRTYGGLADAEKINTARRGMTQGNNFLSLPDLLTFGAGAASGAGLPAAASIGIGQKLARQYGNSVMAVGARSAADLLERGPKAAGKFYSILQRAAETGGPALALTHEALLKEPDYRRLLEQYQKTDAMKRRLEREGKK